MTSKQPAKKTAAAKKAPAREVVPTKKAAPARAKKAPAKKAAAREVVPTTRTSTARVTFTGKDGVDHSEVLYIDASGRPVCADTCICKADQA